LGNKKIEMSYSIHQMNSVFQNLKMRKKRVYRPLVDLKDLGFGEKDIKNQPETF